MVNPKTEFPIMGLDSVEIVIQLEQTFDVQILDREAEGLTTPRETMELIGLKLGVSDAFSPCPGLRAFRLVRHGIREAAGDPDLRVRGSDRVGDFYRRGQKKEFWTRFSQSTGLSQFRPPSLFWRTPLVREIVEIVCARHLHHLRRQDEPWTEEWIRFGVRAVVMDVVGVREFSDGDRYVEDIGVD